MTSRTRVRSENVFSGNIDYLWNGNIYGGRSNSIHLDTHRCEDTVGQRDSDNPLRIIHSTQSFQPLNGRTEGSVFWEQFRDMVPDCYTEPANPRFVELPIPPNSRVYATQALARTNPSRPVVDSPVFFAELRELPELFRLAGKTLLKKGASAYLSYNYGWKPLLSDIRNYLDFQQHVARRTDELNRLYSKGGLKRRIVLDNVTRSKVEDDYPIHTANAYIKGRASTTVSRKTWATVRWVPDANKIPRTDMTMHQLARNLVFGLQQPSFHTAWEAMPWSWLIDWGTTIGDFLAANRNSVGAHHTGSICVMTQIKEVTQFSRTGGPSTVTGGSGTVTRITKLRDVETGPSLETDLRFLSNWQLSILGAIGITRIRGRL